MHPNREEGGHAPKSHLHQSHKRGNLSKSHESSPRTPERVDSGGSAQRSTPESAPLQCRARFLQNWSWQLIADLNRGLCEGRGAQFGFNSEAQKAGEVWEKARLSEITLRETFDLLREFHKRAPFLLFNGNTFAEVGRVIANVVLQDLPAARRYRMVSVIAHYIAGVFHTEDLENAFRSLSTSEPLGVGDAVESLGGKLRGRITQILDENCVQVRTTSGSLIKCTVDSLKKRGS